MYLATRNLSDSPVFVSFKINIDDLVILFIIIINISQKCVLQNFYINVVELDWFERQLGQCRFSLANHLILSLSF